MHVFIFLNECHPRDHIAVQEGKEASEFWDFIGGKETYATTERLKVSLQIVHLLSICLSGDFVGLISIVYKRLGVRYTMDTILLTSICCKISLLRYCQAFFYHSLLV